MQQQDLPAAAAAEAAEATSSSKHQQAEVRSILLSRHPLQSTPPQREDGPHLLLCPLRPRQSRAAKKNQTKFFQILPGRHLYSPMSTLDPNRLGILSSLYLHNHQASSAVSAPQQRPSFNRKQGIVAAKIRSVAARVHGLAAAAASSACLQQRLRQQSLQQQQHLQDQYSTPPRPCPSPLRHLVHG